VVQTEITGIRVDGNYRTNLEHILVELQYIESRLYQYLKDRSRANSSGNGDGHHSFYISAEEMESLEDNPAFLIDRLSVTTEDPAFSSLVEPDTHEKFSGWKGVSDGREGFRLDTLAKIFRLSRPETDILLICLLPEIEPQYQRLYAYLQDDITRKQPTVDLALNLLYNSLEEKLRARDIFAADSSLIKNQLVHLIDDHNSLTTPFQSKIVRIDERIIDYLLGSDRIDARIGGPACLIDNTYETADTILPDEISDRLPGLLSRYRNNGLIIHIRDTHCAGQKDTAGAIGKAVEMPLLYVDLERITAADTTADMLLSLVFREGLLQKAALYFSGFDLLINNDKAHNPVYENLAEEISKYPHWVFLSGDKEWYPGQLPGTNPCISIELSDISYTERAQLWEQLRKGNIALSSDINLADIAGKFRLRRAQIQDALITARNFAISRDPLTAEITGEDLYAACHKISGGMLSALAHRIQPKYRWEDIVLPDDQVEQLHEICGYVDNYHTVYGTWGFGRKLSTGKGLNALFAGPSGTGKTMAADIIANELKLELYKIDLSTIVSKYIGETEKNLERIFHEGQTSNAILFFDEADALFGKRSEVKDAHDRYANIEIAYLLQRMDDYEGVVILATNLRNNLDEAFARRMQFVVEFPLPEEPDRLHIWSIIFPVEAPLSPDIDLRFMSRFKITGGNIKNIAVYAAFLAVREEGVIQMEHLIRATRREYQKTGRLCTEEDFAQYFDMVKS
jgi:hypothetical protein